MLLFPSEGKLAGMWNLPWWQRNRHGAALYQKQFMSGSVCIAHLTVVVTLITLLWVTGLFLRIN